MVGATSRVGRDTTAELLRRGARVRVMVRKDSDAGEFEKMGAEAARGDVRDAAALRSACEGVDTVISLFGRHFSATEAMLWEIDAGGNEALVRAARDCGVRRYLLLSVLGADRDLKPVVFRVKRRAEEAVVSSGLSYTIVRPSTFVEGPSSLIGILGPPIERYGLAPVPAPDSRPVSFVTMRDLASAIVALALAPEKYANRIVELGGATSPTLSEGAALLAAALRRRVRIVRIPRPLVSAGRVLARLAGFGPYEAVLFFEMLRDHGYYCAPDGLREVLGRDPETIAEALARYYASQARTSWRDSIYGHVFLRSQ